MTPGFDRLTKYLFLLSSGYNFLPFCRKKENGMCSMQTNKSFSGVFLHFFRLNNFEKVRSHSAGFEPKNLGARAQVSSPQIDSLFSHFLTQKVLRNCIRTVIISSASAIVLDQKKTCVCIVPSSSFSSSSSCVYR